jgi:hypothetical protein
VAGLLRGVRPIGLWSISITLSIFHAVERFVHAGFHLRAVELALERGEQRLIDERDFPLPLTPVMQTKPPSGMRTSHFEIVFPAPFEFEARRSGSTGRRWAAC